MPPVLTTNYDYDYDTFQPYFFHDLEEEGFYPLPRSQLLPGPGEDIWKKFELLPTPPLSPSRTPSPPDVPPDVPLSAADHLEAVSDLLAEDCGSSASFLQSFIIQDCMWSSSFAAATRLEQVVSERLASLRTRRDSPAAAAEEQLDRSSCQVNAEYLQDLHAAASNCVDPSVVFPCTPTGVEAKTGSEPSLDSPPLSSSDSESEEEEEEEEEEMEEDGEEEIDVVTVDRQKTSRRSDVSPLVLKRSHISIHQHNYAAPQPAGKRAKAESSAPKPSGGGGRRCWSPPSDGSDDDRRRTHNVLERQRRNELRISFQTLRDEVPAVAQNDKAAKVAILKEAAAFIREVAEDERRLLAAKEELRRRSRELRRRLEQLRTSH